MEIWLSDGTHDKLKIPVNPEEIGAQGSSNFDDIVLASGDEKTVIGGNNLRTFSLTSFFPKNFTYLAEYNGLEPMEYVNKIQKWKEDRKVLLFQVTTTNINQEVTIRSFDWSESGGAVGDIDYSIEFKEYKPITYSVLKTETPDSKPSKRPPSTKPTPKTYTVVKGDSLWKISKTSLGDGSKWKKIYERNKSVIGKNPNLIYPGQKLVIPQDV